MTVEYSEITQLSKNMQRAADYAPRTVDTWLHKVVGPALVQEMKKDAPVASGKLRDAIEQQNAPHQVTVGPRNIDYNAFVVEGTKPHVIRSKKGGYLAFKVAGRTVFAREVHHPGTKPNPYMNIAAEVVSNRLLPQLTGLTIKMMKTGDVG